MGSPIRLGIAGLGSVGTGVVRIIQKRAPLLAARAGRSVVISAISARVRGRDRGVNLDGLPWESDPVRLAERADVDVFVELMGGEGDPAKAAIETALRAGKHVVTANKALLAHHGQALAVLAESRRCCLRFEAAVAGGIPVIKALGEGLAANRITRVMGVMNGTCNYILTRMQAARLPYEEVFAEAQALGYLEADPALDVGGIDAAHKLALLAAMAFGVRVDFDRVQIEGIAHVSTEDIFLAAALGYRIKLLGIARQSDAGLEQRVSPCLVSSDSFLGKIEGSTNMVVIEGDAVGQVVLSGPGEGSNPTASAVLGDVCDIACHAARPWVFGQPASALVVAPAMHGAPAVPFYLRMSVQDRPGVLAAIATALANESISIDRMRQPRHDAPITPLVIITHKTQRARLDRAVAALQGQDVLTSPPIALRIEDL